MNSKQDFRQLGGADPELDLLGNTGRWALIALAIVVLILLFARMHEQDEADAVRAELAAMSDFARGRQAGREELLPTVRAAYEQGLADASTAAAGTPGGIALAQACLVAEVRGARP